MPDPATPAPTLTTAQAAARLGVTTSTVQRWARTGHLPYLGPPAPGRGYRFSGAAVDQYRQAVTLPADAQKRRQAAALPPRLLAAHLSWLRQRGCSETTITTRRRFLLHLAHVLPRGLLGATEADMAQWRASLTTGRNPISRNTIVCYVSHAHSFYAWAVTAGLVPANPAEGLPVPRRARGLPRPAAEDALMAAVATAPPRIRAWIALAGWAGLRAREIAYLRREDIHNHAAPPVLLVTREAAKGGNERTVPLHPFVLAELYRAGLPRAGWVFRRADGQPGPNRPQRVSALANQHLHESGAGCTLHQARHRFGTAVYRATHDLRVTQELMGHASPATTAVYTAWDRANAAAAVESLPVPGQPGRASA